jgi:membrane protein required for colicin V production
MFDLTTLDYVYVAVLVLSTVWATIRGGIFETVATLSWVIAAFAARFISPLLDKLLQSWFDLSASTVGTLVASYFVVFFVILMLVGFFNQRLREKIQNSIMNVTDRTLGIIFGLIRGIVIMGVVYWCALWYYSDAPRPAPWVENARTRPIMQLTAVKLDEWFFPGPGSKLLARDVRGSQEAQEIFENLINPAVSDGEKSGDATETETGYKSSERSALEKQLLQIENAARAEEERAAATADTPAADATDATAATTAEMENAADEVDDGRPQYGTADAPVTSD